MWWTTVALAAEPDASELVATFTAIRAAADAGDAAAAAALTRALFPDQKALAHVLRKDAPPGFVDAVLADASSWGAESDADVATMLVPAGRTECRAFSATTEQIRAHQAQDFPGGAVQLAEQALEAEVRWYEVSCTAPGEALGTRFHLFFVHKGRWQMLGPAWRGLK